MKSLDALDVVPGANAGFEFELVDPSSGDGTGMFITVLGVDSDEYRKRVDAVQQARAQKLFRGGQFRPNAISTPAEDRAKEIEIQAATTKSWRTVTPGEPGEDSTVVPTLNFRGKDYDCTPENAKLLYAGIPPMFEQAQQQARNRANFVKGA